MRKIIPKTEDYMACSEVGIKKKEKAKPVYPIFRLDLKHIPEAKDWKLGDEAMIEIKVKMVALSQSRFDDSAEFEIYEIDTEALKKKSKEKE